MTLARYVGVTRPRSAQIVLEPSEQLTALVREQLPLPRRSGIKVRAVDGRSGLEALRPDFADVVLVDAFDGARVPSELVTRECFAIVADRLVDGGVVVLNLADLAPFAWLRRVLRAAEQAFPHLMVSAEPATLKGRRFGNVLVAASSRPLPVAAVARRAASSPFPYRVLDGDELTRRLGGGRPFTDDDTAPSPPPPGGAAFFS